MIRKKRTIEKDTDIIFKSDQDEKGSKGFAAEVETTYEEYPMGARVSVKMKNLLYWGIKKALENSSDETKKRLKIKIEED